MGKFYVYIQVNTHNYKVNREDVREVHSRPKNKCPALPAYHPIHKADRAHSLATSASDQEYLSSELEEKGKAWSKMKIHPLIF